MKTLTQKQEKFIRNLVSGMNQREAYRAAYGCKGWKNSSIDSQATKMLNRPNVLQRYQNLMQTAANIANDDAIDIRVQIIDQEKISAFYNPLDYYKMVGDMLTTKSRDELTEAQCRAIKEIRYNSVGMPYYVFNDRRGAIESLKELYRLSEEQPEDKGAEFVLDESAEGLAD